MANVMLTGIKTTLRIFGKYQVAYVIYLEIVMFTIHFANQSFGISTQTSLFTILLTVLLSTITIYHRIKLNILNGSNNPQ